MCVHICRVPLVFRSAVYFLRILSVAAVFVADVANQSDCPLADFEEGGAPAVDRDRLIRANTGFAVRSLSQRTNAGPRKKHIFIVALFRLNLRLV